MNGCSPQVIKGTTAIWAANDNIVPLSTICIEILTNDTVKMKVGDGIRKFSQLPYYATTGDASQVVVWAPNTPYPLNLLVSYNGELYLSKNNVSASPVFNPNEWRAVTSSGLDAQIESKLSKTAATRNMIENVEVQVSATGVDLNKSTYNMGTTVAGSTKTAIPLADSANAGAMPPGSFTQIVDNTARIEALEGRVSVFLVHFDAFVDPANPTQKELNDSFKAAAGNIEPFDGASLVNDKNTAIVYRYYGNVKEWRLDATGNIAIAALNKLGIVMGSNDDGKVFIENDGSMSVKGYDKIISGKTWPSAGLTTLDAVTGVVNQNTVAVTETDNYTGHQTAKNVLHLKVTEGTALQEVSGLMVNGVRIDFDHESLVIKTSSENTTIQLTKGPYTVTSPRGSVEMYGNLFIFDEKVAGKGIIRRPNGSIEEVENLGIFCPLSTINVIHVFGADDEEVCYILNEKSQSKTLCVYPNGTYKTCDFGTLARTPQNISSIEILSSVNGKRHSYFMRDNRPNGVLTNTAITEYVLFQLEDCAFTIIDSTTKACDGSTNAFTPGANFGDYRIFWEGHTDYEDYIPLSKDVIDTSYADSTNLNRRLPYKTGQWQTESGSIMRNRRIRATHNGVYNFSKGAQVLWGQFNTNNQAILITPEGFISWFTAAPTLSQWYYKDWREVEIKAGKYAGKRGIILYSIDGGTKANFIVNTYNGDPINTVCVPLNTNTDNLHHISGINPIGGNYNIIPSMPYNDGIRVYLGQASVGLNGRYLTYFNQAEIAPSVKDTTTGLWTQKFDAHCLDSLVDTTVANLVFNCNSWQFMEHIEFAAGSGKGTIVKGLNNLDVFFPSSEDTWDGTKGIRPHFIRRPNDVATFYANSSGALLHWLKHMNTKVTWNNHHIQCLGTATGPVTTTLALDYFYDTVTSRIKCRAITFAAGFYHLPIIIDNKHLILWCSDGTAKCVALTWDSTMGDFTVTDGGVWNPPRGTNGHILYVRKPTIDESLAGVKPKLYFFDVRTARTDYLSLTYTEDGAGVSTPVYSTFGLPKSMICNHIIAYPNRKILLTVGAADTAAYYLTLEVSSSVAVMYPDSIKLLDVYDISNTSNANETADGAYAVFSGDLGYFYVIERDSMTGIPIVTKYLKRANVNRRIWALPPGMKNGTQTMRFAVGCGQANGVVSTASSPVTIIERIGGTITDVNPNPIAFTEVRDFGTEANAAARADLPVLAMIWAEPHLVGFDSNVVRFMPGKTQHLGDAFSQKQDMALLGYKDGVPIYGELVQMRIDMNSYPNELAFADVGWFEVGLTKERDSYIYTGTSYGCAYKLAEGWEAFKNNTEFLVGSTFAGGNRCTLWLGNQSTDNHYGSPMTRVLVENEIVTSTVTGHVAGQFTHMASFPMSAAPIAGGTVTTMGPQNAWGHAWDFKIRKHRLFRRDLSREQNVGNWSINEAPTFIGLLHKVPYAALAATEYLVARGESFVPVFATTARQPVYEYYDNQIMPGIYHKRDNQMPSSYSGAETNIVPYFEFTDEATSMVFKNLDNTTIPGIMPFTGLVTSSKQREGETADMIFMTREVYDPSTGDCVVMCFYKENGISKYREIVVPRAEEFIEQITYSVGKMEFSGDTKKWDYDLATKTITMSANPPYALAAVTFDKGIDIASLRGDDGYKLYVYKPQRLVMEYQGKTYWTIPMFDLVLRGQTVAEYVTVTNTVRANALEVSNIEAGSIFLTSKYPKVTY